jgi:hypothetical protein
MSTDNGDGQYRLGPIQDGRGRIGDENGDEEEEITFKPKEEVDDSLLIFDFLKRKRPMPSPRRLDYMLSVPTPFIGVLVLVLMVVMRCVSLWYWRDLMMVLRALPLQDHMLMGRGSRAIATFSTKTLRCTYDLVHFYRCTTRLMNRSVS